MMKLFTVCMTVFFMFVVFACTDDTADPAASVEQLDVASSDLGEAELTDVVVDDVDQSLDDAIANQDATVSSVDAGDVDVTELDDAEQLANDPTEDPANHSAFYEFPDWEVPSSDNDGNR